MLAACLWRSWQLAPTWHDTLARDTHVVAVWPDRVGSHVELAKAQLFTGLPDDALQTIARARTCWPEDVRLAREAGEAHRRKQNWLAAEAELHAAAAAMPKNARVQYYYGLTLADLGKTDDARRQFEALLQDNPAFLPAMTALADIYLTKGHAPQARALLESVIGINPTHRDSLFKLSLLAMDRNDFAESERLLRRVLEVEPRDLDAKLNLAAALSQQNRLAEALAITNDLVTTGHRPLTVRYNRAEILSSLGNYDAAEADYRWLLSQNPDMEEAKRGLQEAAARRTATTRPASRPG